MPSSFLSHLTRTALVAATLGSSALLADSARVTLEIKSNTGQPVDGTFLATFPQVIQKSEILYPVIEQLGLVQKFGKPREEIAQLLRDHMTVERTRGTSLVEIVVSQPDQKLAADIVTAIATTYKEIRLKELQQSVEATLGEMKDELQQLQARVSEASVQANALRQKFNISDPEPESANSVVGGDNFEPLEKAVSEQSLRVAQLSARCEALEKLSPEELIESLAALKIEDPVVNQALPRLTEIEAEEAGLVATGVLEKDPRLTGLRAQKEVYQRKLQQRPESIRRGERNILKIEQERLAAGKNRLERQQAKGVAEKATTLQYLEAKASYLMSKTLANVMEQRYAAHRFDNALAVEPVKIWALPEQR